MPRRLMTAAAAALLSTGASAQTLEALRWNSRVLVLSAAEAGCGDLDRQVRLFRDREEDLGERDLVVLAVEGSELRAVFGQAPAGETAASLRKKLKLSATERFRAVLVGKDGGIKWQAREPTALPEINSVIDAMPMRRAGSG